MQRLAVLGMLVVVGSLSIAAQAPTGPTAATIAAMQVTKVTDRNGHIPVSTWNDLRQYAEFSQDFVEYATRARQAGRTVDQAAAEYKVPERFAGYTATVMPTMSVVQNMRLAYDELGRSK